jgi:hypothetical protein
MTEPTTPHPPRRSKADYRWSRTKIIAFLKALPATLSVAEAARSVGMSRQSAYRLRARLGPGFGAVWDDGLTLGLTLRRAGIARTAGAAGVTQDDALAQGDTPASQGDTLLAQADTGSRHRVTLAPQGDIVPRPPVTLAAPHVTLTAARVALAAAQATLAAPRVSLAPQRRALAPAGYAPAPQSYGRRT